ncbi:MAG TPA: TetR/AcrR family transcriptional regulator [Kineosporiaceae bacterium]|nr:TetR/AcrR family transcriptional regulator [Kineosporiaceae bacterium]
MRSASKPRYHHGDLEQALVDEAVRQIRERGVDQVSLRGLAQAVGVSPSAAYQHFPDKAALMVAVCAAEGAELAARMQAAVDEVPAEGDTGAIGRFLAVGRAYVTFAQSEPHLFRHMFGPSGAQDSPYAEGHDHPDGDDAYGILLARLAELAERGLLRPGVGDDPALDVLAWSLVHGFSSLMVEGHLPLEAGEPVIALFGRLVLTDSGFATFAAALEAQRGEQPVGR